MAHSELEKVLRDFDIRSDAGFLFDCLEHEAYVVDKNLVIRYANHKLKEVYGEDIVGRRCYESFPLSPRITRCTHCPCPEVFEGRLFSENECFETKDRDGRSRYVSETATPLKNKKGERVLALVLGRDITKRVRLESIKKDFYGLLGSTYELHLRLIVDSLNKLGYRRVRLYDVIDDCLSPEDPLFVLRAQAGMGEDKLGHKFHLRDDGYRQLLSRLATADVIAGGLLGASYLTEARLLEAKEFSENNISLHDLAFQDTRWIMLPLLARDKPAEGAEGYVSGQPSGKKLVGLLSVDNRGSDSPVANDDLILLKGFADFLGEAIVAVRAEVNLHILNRISRLINEKRTSGETHQLIAKEVCEQMQAGMCSIFINDDRIARLVLHAGHVSSSVVGGPRFRFDFTEQYDYGQNITGRAHARGEAFNLIDFETGLRAKSPKDERFRELVGEVDRENIKKHEESIMRQTGKPFRIRNAIFAPLVFEDHRIGVIRVVNNFTDGRFPFPDSDLELLKMIALQVAAHTHYEAMKTDLDNAVSEISRTIAEKHFDPKEIAQKIVLTVKKMSNALAVTLFLKDEGKPALHSIAVEGYPAEFTEELEYSLSTTAYEHGIGITAWVALTGKPFQANSRDEIEQSSAYSGKYEIKLYGENRRAQSLIAVPLKTGNDTIGVLKVEDPEPAKFGKSFRTMFDVMASLASLAIYSSREIKRRQELMTVLGHELSLPAITLSSMGDVMMRRYSSIEEEEIPEGEDFLVVRKSKLLGYCDDLIAESHHLRFLTSEREALDTDARFSFELGSLRSLLREVIRVLRSPTNWKYIDINLPRSSPRCDIEMDRSRIRRVLYNLMHNAIKYSYQEGVIETELSQTLDSVILKVRDFGIGIPSQESGNIFAKGYRCFNALERDPTGTGLGLYYVRQIIGRHHGSIKLTSTHNPTEFTVILPLRQTWKE